MTDEEMDALVAAMDGKAGDLLLFAADKKKLVYDVLGALRLELAEQMEAPLARGGTCRHDRLLYGRGKAGRTSGCDGRSSRKGRIHRPAAEIIWKMGGFSQ